MRRLTEIQRQAPEALLANLRSTDAGLSHNTARKLIAEAKDFGVTLPDYLRLAVNPAAAEKPAQFNGLDGFEATLAFLNLPFRDDFSQGIMLQAAADAFQTYPGTRAMFPEVIDQMVRWKNRQDKIETADKLVAQSRTINGTELISTVIEDDKEARRTSTIAEFGRIPVRRIGSSQSSVAIYKHGSGIEMSYEFERRASLDILTPFASRVGRELEISKVQAATYILLNGDGVNPAAQAVNFSAFGGVAVDATNPLAKQYRALATWLVKRAQAGVPVNTIVGNLDIYLELLFMFTPTVSAAKSEVEAISAQGGPGIKVGLPILGGNVEFVLSSAMPANKILGFSKEDTLEELVEAGSRIAENERAIQNQSITYVQTENTGYKIAMGDTRSLLDLGA